MVKAEIDHFYLFLLMCMHQIKALSEKDFLKH